MNNQEKKTLRDFLGVQTIAQAKRKLKLQGVSAQDTYTAIKAKQDRVKEKVKKSLEKVRAKIQQKRSATLIQKAFREKQQRKQNVVDTITNVPQSTNIHTEYKQYIKRFLGKTIKVYTYSGQTLISEVEVEVPATISAFNRWWGNQFWSWIVDTDNTILDVHKNVKIVFTPAVHLTPTKVKQMFAEGISNCMLTPIRNFCIEKMNTATTERTVKKYRQLENKVAKLIEKYPDGIPENDIQEISNHLQINISIDLPFSRNHYIDCKSIKKALNSFNFINTRLNHLDLNEVVNDTPTTVTQDELQKLGEELYNSGKYFLFIKNKDGKYFKIQTLTENYIAINHYTECVNEFEKESGLSFCKLDYINDEVVEFIKQGVHFNSAIEYNEKTEEMKHIDMEKAYANYRKCKWFNKFVGKITDWRQVKADKSFLEKNIGYYRVKTFDFTNVKSKAFEFLNCYIDGNVYGSPELLVLMEYGVKIETCEGAWGIAIDFNFTEDMIKSKDAGVSYYAKWTGQQFSFNDRKSFSLKGDQSFFENIIAENTECEVRYYNDEGTISYPKKRGFNLVQITGFITMYQRLSVVEQLMELDLNKVLKISTDGIFYEDHEFKIVNSFREKDTENFGGADGFYCSNIDFENVHVITENKFRKSYHKELFLGAGGNGKTHYNLNDKGLVKVCYIAPSWKLSTAKGKEYAVGNSVVALMTHPTRKYDLLRQYNTFVIDEVSMMSQETKEFLLKQFCMCKLIFCGDVGFQLPSFEGVSMNTEGFDNTTTFTENYRFTCDKHANICLKVREMISEEIDKETISKFIFSQYENVKELDYKPTDIILCSRTKCGVKDHKSNCNCNGKNYSAEWTNKYGDTKWKCLERTAEYYHGDIYIGEKPKGKWEARHGYTIHSVQGETYDGNIFIDSRNLFDVTMGYTAISRARKWEQIKIIV